MSSRLATTLAILAPLALAGCARGPDADALRKEVADRLAQALPDGTLELTDFARGAAPRRTPRRPRARSAASSTSTPT